ncbi:DUF551 domain-containing protein [Cupriavidus sp. EM10]|uniref:DUF551 domain-containing protein n=1 Tax=Cupriavidus sp. EM10 TaxID=2839983 RepID=UPI001BFFDC0C|nr:DUF551 domain-containing protein [Cupriavidus sp. EM10]QWE95622.1 DUF551 domain-containing protein [Cupriavidus sp. EM10]
MTNEGFEKWFLDQIADGFLWERESAHAAWQASRKQSGWQPIETAPKWKEVLVWREDSGSFIAKLVAPEDVPEADAESWEDPSIPVWLSDAYGWQEGSETPTHWMPLPQPPAMQKD